MLGEFAAEDGLISIEWVEAAVESEVEAGEGRVRIGLDVARHGDDQTIAAIVHPGGRVEIKEFSTQDTAATGADLVRLMRKYDADAVVDADGMGVGIYDFLRREGEPVHGFFGGAAVPNWRDSSGLLGAFNRRSAGWWDLRERLKPDSDRPLSLPDMALLIGDVTAPREAEGTSKDARGRIKIESKDQTKRRLGRSPDYGDALMMAVAVDVADKLDKPTKRIAARSFGDVISDNW